MKIFFEHHAPRDFSKHKYIAWAVNGKKWCCLCACVFCLFWGENEVLLFTLKRRALCVWWLVLLLLFVSNYCVLLFTMRTCAVPFICTLALNDVWQFVNIESWTTEHHNETQFNGKRTFDLSCKVINIIFVLSIWMVDKKKFNPGILSNLHSKDKPSNVMLKHKFF